MVEVGTWGQQIKVNRGSVEMGKGPRFLAAGTREFGHRASSVMDHKMPLLAYYLINYWIDMQNLSKFYSTCTAHAQVDRLPPS